MAQPQVENDPDAADFEADTGVKRTPSNSSQPAQLSRPLKESARLANIKSTDTIRGVDYTVTPEGGYRKA